MLLLMRGLMYGLITHKKRSIKESTQVRYDDFYRRYIEKQMREISGNRFHTDSD